MRCACVCWCVLACVVACFWEGGSLSFSFRKTHTHNPPLPSPTPLLSYYGLKPDIKVIAPWREWDLNSRTKLIAYAEAAGIAVPASKRGEPPFSMDANLLHISYEGNALEDPWAEPDESMFTRSVSPESAPDAPTYVEIEFEKGDPVALNGARLSPATMLAELNKVGGRMEGRGCGGVLFLFCLFVCFSTHLFFPIHPHPPPPRSPAPTASAAWTSSNPASSA